MEVRGTAFLGLDGAEVLHVPPDAAAGVLPEPVQQRREMDRVSRGPPIVIPVRIHRGPVAVHPPVGIQGKGQERRGPVASGEDPPHRPFVDRSAWQIRGVLAAPGGALDRLGWQIKRGEPATDSGGAQFSVEFGDRVGDLLTGDLIADGLAFGVDREQIGPGGHQRRVVLTRRSPADDRFVRKVPTLAALGHPLPSGLVRTRPTLVFPGGPTSHRHHLDSAGDGVDPAHGQWPDTDAVPLGQSPGDISADRQRSPLRPSHRRDIDSGGISSGHQALTCPSVLAVCRNTASGMLPAVSGASSALRSPGVAAGPW
jgi:hypothetical protein